MTTNPRDTPCHICGGTAFTWGEAFARVPLLFRPETDSTLRRLLGVGDAHSLDARVCDACSNVQLFVRE